MIKEVNPYYKIFMSYRKVLEDHDKNHPNVNLRMYLIRPNDQDPVMQGNFNMNRYSTEIASGQVAGVIEEDEGNIPSNMSVNIF